MCFHFADGRRLSTSLIVCMAAAIALNCGATRGQEKADDQGIVVEELPLVGHSDSAPSQPVPSVDAADADATVTSETDALGYTALPQGPVHEAFAVPEKRDPDEAVRFQSEAPPLPIDERPPEDKPDGEGITWIPGYWSWSDSQSKYVWVSGLYRKVPPRRSWVSGYWSKGESGYQWTRGYWLGPQDGVGEGSAENSTAANQPADGPEELPLRPRDLAEYLPEPPPSIDNGPSVAAPAANYFWLPGHWEYEASGYQWRSGYWTRHHDGWVWQPACYVRTPHGYVYVDGYWDVLPPERGQLYAPVDFYSPVYLQSSYVYRPRFPLANAALLLSHFFVRPGHSHYFYGDFYGTSFLNRGYRPWYESGYAVHSPLLGYYNWKYGRVGLDYASSMKRFKTKRESDPPWSPYRETGAERRPNTFSSSGFGFANESGNRSRSPADSNRQGRDVRRSVETNRADRDLTAGEPQRRGGSLPFGAPGLGRGGVGEREMGLQGRTPAMGRSTETARSPESARSPATMGSRTSGSIVTNPFGPSSGARGRINENGRVGGSRVGAPLQRSGIQNPGVSSSIGNPIGGAGRRSLSLPLGASISQTPSSSSFSGRSRESNVSSANPIGRNFPRSVSPVRPPARVQYAPSVIQQPPTGSVPSSAFRRPNSVQRSPSISSQRGRMSNVNPPAIRSGRSNSGLGSSLRGSSGRLGGSISRGNSSSRAPRRNERGNASGGKGRGR